MSPDPPPRSEEEINSGTIYFMQGPDDDEDDFMDDPNGEHVLDFSDHESDFSDDDDEVNNGQERAVNPPPNENGTNEPNQRMMARYQLLIPFPQSENNVESSETENELEQQQQVDQEQSSPQSTSVLVENSSEETITTPKNDDDTDGVSKRELVLTDDSIETIKNAMKGFSLPSSSIPQWVEKVDENSWKERLFETLNQKPSSK